MVKNASSPQKAFRQTTPSVGLVCNCSRETVLGREERSLAPGLACIALAFALLSILVLVCASTASTAQGTTLLVGGPESPAAPWPLPWMPLCFSPTKALLPLSLASSCQVAC